MSTDNAEATPAPNRKSGKKPGRPKGAQTQEHPVVHEFNATCPRCGSSKRSKKQSSPPVYHAQGGKQFKIVRARVQCKKCKQNYVILTKYDIT